MNEALELWNGMVKLKRPSLGVIEAASAVSSVSVFSHVPSIRYLRSNLLLMLPVGMPVVPQTAVQSATLVATSWYCSQPTSVRTADLPEFLLFGISTGRSANEFLSELRNLDRENVNTATSPNKWEILYGGAYTLHFRSRVNNDADSAKARLVAIHFRYGTPYTGNLPTQCRPK